jgi:hypothetical protein
MAELIRITTKSDETADSTAPQPRVESKPEALAKHAKRRTSETKPPVVPAELLDLVTLDQAAAAVHRKKRTLERRKTRGMLPPPTVEGGGGKPDLWHWSEIRPWLQKEFGVILPERFFANVR